MVDANRSSSVGRDAFTNVNRKTISSSSRKSNFKKATNVSENNDPAKRVLDNSYLYKEILRLQGNGNDNYNTLNSKINSNTSLINSNKSAQDVVNNAQGLVNSALEDVDEAIEESISPYQDAFTIYVRTTGSDTSGDGTLTNPYRTLEKAYEIYKTYSNRFVDAGSGDSTSDPFNILSNNPTPEISIKGGNYPAIRIDLGEGIFDDVTDESYVNPNVPLLIQGKYDLVDLGGGKPNTGSLTSSSSDNSFVTTVAGTVWADHELKGKEYFLRISLSVFGSITTLPNLIPIVDNAVEGANPAEVTIYTGAFGNGYTVIPGVIDILYEIVEITTLLTLDAGGGISFPNIKSNFRPDINDPVINSDCIYNIIKFNVDLTLLLYTATYISCSADCRNYQLSRNHLYCSYTYGKSWDVNQNGVTSQDSFIANLYSTVLVRSSAFDPTKTTDDLRASYLNVNYCDGCFIDRIYGIKLSHFVKDISFRRLVFNIINNTQIYMGDDGSYNVSASMLNLSQNKFYCDDAGATNQMIINLYLCKVLASANKFEATFNYMELINCVDLFFRNNTMAGACVDNYFFHLDETCKISFLGTKPDGQVQQFILGGVVTGTLGSSQLYLDRNTKLPYSTNGNPGANNDKQDTASIGYAFNIGDMWINTSGVTIFMCTDDTAGSAVWTQIA